ncbi:MAG: SIR2 family protein [Chlorobiaceae bacterium]
MIVSSIDKPEHLADIRDSISTDWTTIAESADSVESILKHTTGLLSSNYEDRLKGFKTFIPPRLVSAAKIGNVAPFFGAGVSIAAGIPTWSKLLEKLGVSEDLAQEPNLENDPLTLAELLAHEIGFLELQRELRTLMNSATIPSIVHYLLAQLSQGVYITTNYDTLFEVAWKKINGGTEPIVITTDADFTFYGINPKRVEPIDDRTIILKIHGCASKDDEEMILTRSQYRRHYRTNTQLFDAVRDLMLQKHMLFIGFSHRDPEITRLVDDAIYKYENNNTQAPEYYSLQFDMKEKTPEVFAARGMVALRPPISLTEPKYFDYRTAGLSKALVDFCAAMDSKAHETLDIDTELRNGIAEIELEVSKAMKILSDAASQIELNTTDDNFIQKILDFSLISLRSIAGQGLYLLRKNGDIWLHAIPASLANPERRQSRTLSRRFYVQQAKTFKEKFVSDSDKSKFNDHSTVFFCVPLGDKKNYKGVLFCASQIGAWKIPIVVRDSFLAKHPDGSFILVDSNGVVLLPPNDEFPVGGSAIIPSNESQSDNMGFEYEKLKRISRRDHLVTRIWRNIVPINQDDDVCNFSDLAMYSVVSEIKGTRWKLALSKPVLTKNA